MSDIAIILGIVAVSVIIILVILKGGRLKNISLGKILTATFSPGVGPEPITIITHVPQNVAWMNAKLYFDGRKAYTMKIGERGGEEIAGESAIERQGLTHYSVEVTGSELLYSDAGKPFLTDFRFLGSGEINLVARRRYVIYILWIPGPQGARREAVFDRYENFKSGNASEDVLQAEADRIFGESTSEK